MKITAVDDKKDLFLVEDILPDNIIGAIQQLDLDSLDWELQSGQEVWKRKKLIPPASCVLNDVDPYLNSVRLQIANTIGIELVEYDCWSSFWYDTEGFTTDIHLDGTLPNAMQLYLKNGPENFGTVFYYNNSVPWKVRYKFKYKPNTGYIMLNNPDQWHAVPVVLAAGQSRFSSYTYFGNYSHK